jgi:cytochrome c oxidase cbb3-type subunit 1
MAVEKGTQMENNVVQYDDTPVKQMVYPSIIFLVIGMFIGTFLAFNAFVFPDYFGGEYMTFGRLRPAHVNHVALLWLLAVDMGLIYFYVPRLCGIPLWSSSLATFSNGLYWFATILGVYSLPFGTNYGWEYAELPMLLGGFIPIKVLVTVAYALFATNIFLTIANRRHKHMYVSLWYTMGTLIWTAFTFSAGNLFLWVVPDGISRVNMAFFYMHNLVGLIFTPKGVAIAYYFIPKLTNRPIYSHKMSMIGFWSIAFVYAWIGAHHMIHGPISQWLQTVSIIFSIWLFIPVWTVIANFFLTLKGHWNQYSQSAAIRFLMMGTVFYLLTCIQGPLQALRNVNEITSKTDWIIGHAHMALFGAFTFFSLGGVYYTIPAILKKPLWSKELADWHFTLNLVGGMLFFVSLWVGGFMQGLQWANWATGSSYADYHNNLSQVPFLQTIADMWYWWLFRGIGGLMILFGNILFAINIFNTVMLAPSGDYPEKANAV